MIKYVAQKKACEVNVWILEFQGCRHYNVETLIDGGSVANENHFNASLYTLAAG